MTTDNGKVRKSTTRRRKRSRPEPLEVRVSLSFRFGDEPEDRVLMLDDRRVPMVGSVFEYRDRIARSFALLLLRAGASQPKVLAEILPAARWMLSRGKGRGRPESD
jgi:hypothetical protein